jgi:hypothetical protein
VAVTGLVETNVGTTLLLTPAGTVMVAGTVAVVLLLENETTAPPAGAGAVSVTVVDAVEPPWTLTGATLTVSSVVLVDGGGVAPVTVRVAVREMPLYAAELTEVEVEPTALVAKVAAPEATPAGTVKVAGTVAAAGLLLVKDT